ncbi:MAG: DNA-binding response regulator, partial [Actinomycetota bacterium]|nr:DNA-binding response regulator [Actinomycetota bacterium]
MVDRGREAYRQRAWSDAYEMLSAADQQSPLEPADLELLAMASYLLGRDEVGDDLSARAYRDRRT